MSLKNIFLKLPKTNDGSADGQYISYIKIVHTAILQSLMGANFAGIKTAISIDRAYLSAREAAYRSLSEAAGAAGGAGVAEATTRAAGGAGAAASSPDIPPLGPSAVPDSRHRMHSPEISSTPLTFDSSTKEAKQAYIDALLAELIAFEKLVCDEAEIISEEIVAPVDLGRLTPTDYPLRDQAHYALEIYQNIIHVIQTKTRRQEKEAHALHSSHSIHTSASYATFAETSRGMRRSPHVLTEIIQYLVENKASEVETSLLGILRDSGYTASMLAALSYYATTTGAVISVRAIHPDYRDTILAYDLGLFGLTGEGYSIQPKDVVAAGKPIHIKAKTVKGAGNFAQNTSPSAEGIHTEGFIALEKVFAADFLTVVIQKFRGNPPVIDPTYGDGRTLLLTSLDGEYIWRVVPDESLVGHYRLLNISGLKNNDQESLLMGEAAQVPCEIGTDGIPRLIVADTDLMSIDTPKSLKLDHSCLSSNVPSALKAMARADARNYTEVVDIPKTTYSLASLGSFEGYATIIDAMHAMALNVVITTRTPEGKKSVSTIRHPPETYNPETLSAINEILVIGPGDQIILCHTEAAFLAVKKAVLDTGDYYVPINGRWGEKTLKPLRASAHAGCLVYGGFPPGYRLLPSAAALPAPGAEADIFTGRSDIAGSVHTVREGASFLASGGSSHGATPPKAAAVPPLALAAARSAASATAQVGAGTGLGEGSPAASGRELTTNTMDAIRANAGAPTSGQGDDRDPPPVPALALAPAVAANLAPTAPPRAGAADAPPMSPPAVAIAAAAQVINHSVSSHLGEGETPARAPGSPPAAAAAYLARSPAGGAGAGAASAGTGRKKTCCERYLSCFFTKKARSVAPAPHAASITIGKATGS